MSRVESFRNAVQGNLKTASEFWDNVHRQITELSSAKSADDVIRIVGPVPGLGVGDAFFEGSGGDESVYGALMDAGWKINWADADYYFAATAPDGSGITYVEGDIYKGVQAHTGSRKQGAFYADASECTKCGAAISFDPDTNKWADEDNGSTTCAEGGKHSPTSPDEHQSAKRKQGAFEDAYGGPPDTPMAIYMEIIMGEVGDLIREKFGAGKLHEGGVSNLSLATWDDPRFDVKALAGQFIAILSQIDHPQADEAIEALKKGIRSQGSRKQGATLDSGPRDFFVDQLKAQIGMMNILAISGGRVEVHGNGIRLPVAHGYAVVIFLEADDTYTVQTTLSRAGNTRVVNEVAGIYAEQVGESAYQASLFRDKPWEKGGAKTALAEFAIGDRVHLLNQLGRPMTNSTGTGLLTGTVMEVTDSGMVVVNWINPGLNDRGYQLSPVENLVKVVATASRKQGLSGLWRWEQWDVWGNPSADSGMWSAVDSKGQEVATVELNPEGDWTWAALGGPYDKILDAGETATLEEAQKAAEFAGIPFPGSERLPFAAGRHHKADISPTEVGVKVGDIFVATWGYDQTNVDFYEITGLTAASVRVRKLMKTYTESGAMSMAGKSVPRPGEYSSGEVTKRLQWSGYSNEPEIKVGYQTWATPWDGQPEYESHYAKKTAENLSEWVKRGYADFQDKTPWGRAPDGAYEGWMAGKPDTPELKAYWSGFDAAGNDAVYRAGGSRKVAEEEYVCSVCGLSESEVGGEKDDGSCPHIVMSRHVEIEGSRKTAGWSKGDGYEWNYIVGGQYVGWVDKDAVTGNWAASVGGRSLGASYYVAEAKEKVEAAVAERMMSESHKVAYDPEMGQLGDMFNQQFEDMKGKEKADTLPCPEHKDKEATKGGTYASFPSSYTEYHCPEGHDFKVRVGTTREEILAEGKKKMAYGPYPGDIPTPWGYSQEIRQSNTNPGVIQVYTAGHGGVFVPDAQIGPIPTKYRDQAFHERGGYWFEEDVAANIPMKYLPGLLAEWYPNYSMAQVDEAIRYWIDEYESPVTSKKKTGAQISWCQCGGGHWATEPIPVGQYGRCSFCAANCPVIGGCLWKDQQQNWTLPSQGSKKTGFLTAIQRGVMRALALDPQSGYGDSNLPTVEEETPDDEEMWPWEIEDLVAEVEKKEGSLKSVWAQNGLDPFVALDEGNVATCSCGFSTSSDAAWQDHIFAGPETDQFREGHERVSVKVALEDTNTDETMWPVELEDGDPDSGEDAADVDGVPTPGQAVDDYPQPGVSAEGAWSDDDAWFNQGISEGPYYPEAKPLAEVVQCPRMVSNSGVMVPCGWEGTRQELYDHLGRMHRNDAGRTALTLDPDKQPDDQTPAFGWELPEDPGADPDLGQGAADVADVPTPGDALDGSYPQPSTTPANTDSVNSELDDSIDVEDEPEDEDDEDEEKTASRRHAEFSPTHNLMMAGAGGVLQYVPCTPLDHGGEFVTCLLEDGSKVRAYGGHLSPIYATQKQGEWKIIDRYSGDVIDTSPSEDEAFGLADMKVGEQRDLDAVIQGPDYHWVGGGQYPGQWQWTAARSDYEHWNEEADAVWWAEEGSQPESEPDPDPYEDNYNQDIEGEDYEEGDYRDRDPGYASHDANLKRVGEWYDELGDGDDDSDEKKDEEEDDSSDDTPVESEESAPEEEKEEGSGGEVKDDSEDEGEGGEESEEDDEDEDDKKEAFRARVQANLRMVTAR